MGNRRRPNNPKLALEDYTPGDSLNVPIQELTVHKRVPAIIHWGTVDGIDREDDEVIGEAIIYEDGTSDVVVHGDISDDAKNLVGIINSELDHLSVGD